MFYIGQMTSWILDWPYDKLDVTFQMTSPIGQMTSWILPWPNDKLDFTLAK